MATYNSGVYLRGTRLRPGDQCECAETTISYTYPIGTAVVSGDIIKFAHIGENVQILEVEIDNNTSLAASGVTVDVGTSAVADCFIDGNSFGNAGATAISVTDGEATTADHFADGHVLPSTTVVDLQATLAGSIGTAVTDTARTITIRVKYQYAYPEQYISGVSDATYPFAGNITYAPAEVETYNDNAP